MRKLAISLIAALCMGSMLVNCSSQTSADNGPQYVTYGKPCADNGRAIIAISPHVGYREVYVACYDGSLLGVRY